MKIYYVYITTNKKKGTLYIGITSDLIKRIQEHKNKVIQGFTKQYNLDKIVYYEETSNSMSAIEREKQLKNWHRQWKINLIEKENPNWEDLYNKIIL